METICECCRRREAARGDTLCGLCARILTLLAWLNGQRKMKGGYRYGLHETTRTEG